MSFHFFWNTVEKHKLLSLNLQNIIKEKRLQTLDVIKCLGFLSRPINWNKILQFFFVAILKNKKNSHKIYDNLLALLAVSFLYVLRNWIKVLLISFFNSIQFHFMSNQISAIFIQNKMWSFIRKTNVPVFGWKHHNINIIHFNNCFSTIQLNKFSTISGLHFLCFSEIYFKTFFWCFIFHYDYFGAMENDMLKKCTRPRRISATIISIAFYFLCIRIIILVDFFRFLLNSFFLLLFKFLCFVSKKHAKSKSLLASFDTA